MTQETMRNEADAEYYKLPVIYWKDIFGAKQWPFKRRPRQMHSTLSLRGVCVWVERFFGLPMNTIRFIGRDGKLIPVTDYDVVNVKQLQDDARQSCLIRNGPGSSARKRNLTFSESSNTNQL